jgi:hypothetical protein
MRNERVSVNPHKGRPATRHGGTWGDNTCNSYTFLNSALGPGRASPPGKDPRYRWLGGPQSRSGRRGHEKNPVTQPGIEPRPSAVRYYTDSSYTRSCEMAYAIKTHGGQRRTASGSSSSSSQVWRRRPTYRVATHAKSLQYGSCKASMITW